MKIISRAEWGARHPDGFRPAPLPADELWLHHSGGAARNGAQIIRDLEQTGQQRFGGGMSYTFLITPDGTVYAGHSIGRQGSHTANRNDRGRGICWVGDYQTTAPSPEMVASTVTLLRHGVDKGWWRLPRLTGGHRDVRNTDCPGDRAYALIPEINKQAQSQEGDSMASLDSVERKVDLLKPGLVLTHRSSNVRHRAANGRPEDDQYGHVLTAAAEAADARVAAEAALAEAKRLRADLEVALPKIYAQLNQLLAAHEDPGDDNVPTLLSGKG